MLFPTVQFAIFFPIVLALSWALMSRPWAWKPFILLASYVFYASASWRFCLLLGGVTVGNQAAAVLISRTEAEHRRRLLVAGAVALDLLVLGVFKYYSFFVQQTAEVLHGAGLGMPLPLVTVALPVGVSFYTFQAISYVVDVKRRLVEPASLIDAAVYLSFFPHLVAGPIVRAREFLPQLATPRNPENVAVGPGIALIALGLIKKVVIADYLARALVDPVFAVPQAYGGLDVLLAAYGYAAQIYCDFSGYTDMAIGLALLMGFVFPQNFRSPYRATGFRDFWRRWHMTLSRFLRDFLYIPLGGNRGGRLTVYRNLMITMVLAGLWHGAAWTFVLVGRLSRGRPGRRACPERTVAPARLAALAGHLPPRCLRLDPVPLAESLAGRHVPLAAGLTGHGDAVERTGADRDRGRDRAAGAAARTAGRGPTADRAHAPRRARHRPCARHSCGRCDRPQPGRAPLHLLPVLA